MERRYDRQCPFRAYWQREIWRLGYDFLLDMGKVEAIIWQVTREHANETAGNKYNWAYRKVKPLILAA